MSAIEDVERNRKRKTLKAHAQQERGGEKENNLTFNILK